MITSNEYAAIRQKLVAYANAIAAIPEKDLNAFIDGIRAWEHAATTPQIYALVLPIRDLIKPAAVNLQAALERRRAA